MNDHLINIRIDKQRLERVRRLRASGVTLSELVRDAIDRQYEELVKSRKHLDVDAMLEEIYLQHPDPPRLPARDYDVHERGQARNAILRKLRRKR